MRERALVPTLVTLGMVVAVVSSLGAPLIPQIAAADHVSLADAQWSLTITLLLGAVATPCMGRLGDGPHRKQVVLVALALVALGSALAALPLGFAALLVGRGLMGIGLGLTPLAIATARDTLVGERVRSTVALLSISTVAGVGLGYPVTGLVAQHGGLSPAFGLGAGIAVVTLVACAVVLPAGGPVATGRLDLPGAVLLGAGAAGVLLALSEGESWGWTSPRLLALLVGAVVALGLWVVLEQRVAAPLVDLRLLRLRPVLTADVTALLAGIGAYLLIGSVVRLVQTPTGTGYGFGASVTVAGLVLLPFSGMSVAASRVAPALARRTSPHAVLPVGALLFVAALAVLASSRAALWEIFVVMGIAGLGVGCTFAAMPALIVRSVPASETGSAMSFNQVLRYAGYAAGSALSGAVLQAHTPTGQALPTSSGYTVVGIVGAAVCLLSAVVAAVLPRGAQVAAVTPLEAAESVADAEPAIMAR